MIAWMLEAFAGPPALAGLAVCLCRRRPQRLTRDQIAESEVLAGLVSLIASPWTGVVLILVAGTGVASTLLP